MLTNLLFSKPVFIYFLKMAFCIANNTHSHSYISSGITSAAKYNFLPNLWCGTSALCAANFCQ